MEKPEGSLISFFSRRVKKLGGINLAQGRPSFSPPVELMDLLSKYAHKEDLHQYASGSGNFKLLELLVKKYSNLCSLTTNNVLVVKGATEGIFQIFFYLTKILNMPFSVLSFDPVYESYSKLAEIFNIPFVYFDFKTNFAIDFNKLEYVCREKDVKIIFISSPGNPLGKVWTKEEIKKILKISKKLGLYVIFDAVYKDIYFNTEPVNPLIFNSPFLFYVNSFSKMLSITGWRVGYIIAEEAHIKKILSILDYTGLSAPSVLQAVIVEYLLSCDFGKEYINALRKKCYKSYSFLKSELESMGFFVPDIEGGYFIWAKLSERFNDGFSFAWDLYNSVKVGVVPGENFSKSKTDYIRLNFAAELPIIKDGAKRIKQFVKKYRGK